MFLRDTAQKRAALAALDSLRPGSTWLGVAPDRVEARQARWDLAELYGWLVLLEDGMGLASGARINGWGIDPWHNRILLFVVDSASLAALPAWLQRVQAPCRLVAAEAIGEIRAAAAVSRR